MFGSSFRSPLLKQTPASSKTKHDAICAAPPFKRRRIGSSDETKIAGQYEPTMTSPESHGVPRKPLLAVKNPAAATTDIAKPQDGGMEGYYTVLWCFHSAFGFTDKLFADFVCLGVSSLPRNTRHGTVMAFFLSPPAMPTSRTSLVERWVEPSATHLSCPDQRCQLVERMLRSTP